MTSERLGLQTLYRLRCLEETLRGEEFDLLEPFEKVELLIHDLSPERAAPLRNW